MHKLLINHVIWLAVFFSVAGCKNLNLHDAAIENVKSQIKLGLYEEAINSLILLNNQTDDVKLKARIYYMLAGIYYFNLNNFNQAAYYYRILSDNYLDSIYYQGSLSNLADLYLYHFENDKNHKLSATRYLNLLIDTFPTVTHESMLVHIRLADVFFDIGRYQQAIGVYSDIIHKVQDNKQFIQVLAYAYYKIGLSFEILQMVDLAIITYTEIETKTNKSIESLQSAIELAEIYEELGEVDAAKIVYQDIIKRLNADDPLIQFYQTRLQS